MKTAKIVFYIISAFIYIQGCKETGTITNPNTNPQVYKNIFTVTKDSLSVKVYIVDQDSLTTGYNQIFFKVYNLSNEIKNGTINYYPIMWMTPRVFHSTPMKESYNYNSNTGYFSGYVIFIMPTTPPNIIWYSKITYIDEANNQHKFDSASTYVSYHKEKQWRIFLDTTDRKSWIISLLDTYYPIKGLNNYKIMVHKTDEELKTFIQIYNADIKIKVYDIATGNESTGNISPTANNAGYYSGKINLPYVAEWKACDTIWYEGKRVTDNPPPSPDFYYQIK
jgi:hypothetical protein